MKIIIFLLGCLLTIESFAAIYETQDTQGNTIYSDVPKNAQSQVIQPPKTNEISTLNENTTSNTDQTNDDEQTIMSENTGTEPISYKKFEFVTPKNQESIQNQPTLAINLIVEPALQTGDTIQIFLDGSPWGERQANTSFSFTIPYRGTHSLNAKIYNAKKEVIKETPSITIFVHQQHI